MQRVEVKSEQAVPALVEDAVRAIRAGRLVALPTETVYGVAATPDPAGEARLRALKGRREGHVFTVHLADVAAVERVAEPSPRARRALARLWPGPLTAVLPRRGGDGTIGVRVPDHPFTRAVLEQFEHGLLLSSANRSGDEPLADADALQAGLPELDLLFDAGPPHLGVASTVARLDDESCEILRPGAISRQALLQAAARAVLFVCTGNTCRSPLAEALARHRKAEALGTEPAQLLERGWLYLSAGTFAGPGQPASEHSLQVAEEIGLDLRGHRSHNLLQLDPAAVDAVFGLAHSHLQAVLELAPELGDRTELLDPEGHDIPDPFGGSLEVYREALAAIDAAIQRRLAAGEL